jgi:serine/threonine-protein phosphatase 2A regulatory subunit B''
VNKAYESYPNGLSPKAFVDMLLEVCELPTMLGWTLCKRLIGIDELVAKDSFIEFWKSRQLISSSLAVKSFQVLKQDGRSYLTYEDFQPFMDCVLQYHPGLEFLKETAEVS